MTQSPAVSAFTIRVYGILFNGKGEVLVTDEFRLGRPMTKFPGGGMEFGEGPVDCLRRECLEELGQEVRITRHFYTTEFFQQSLLIDPPKQVINIYYFIETIEEPRFPVTDQKFDFECVEGAQAFRWELPEEMAVKDFTFPIDRKVVELLKAGNLNA